jgi:hypothetical protein
VHRFLRRGFGSHLPQMRRLNIAGDFLGGGADILTILFELIMIFNILTIIFGLFSLRPQAHCANSKDHK